MSLPTPSSNPATTKNIRVGIVGVRGYTGMELLRLCMEHPFISLQAVSASETFSLKKLLPQIRTNDLPPVVSFIQPDTIDLIFLATPHTVSWELAPLYLKNNVQVIDLSGAFRLKNSKDRLSYYGESPIHINPYLKLSHYGLCPLFKPEAPLIANPGCYASAISLALLPLLKFECILNESIVIDAKSGTTGAGKTTVEKNIFSEVAEDFRPYRVGQHQHKPEIAQAVEIYTGKKIDFSLCTHLLPIRRGLMASIYAKLSEKNSLETIENAYFQTYADYRFIHHAPVYDTPELASLRKVVGTPNVHITYGVEGETLFVFSCLDNLLKGAASQALENFNSIYHFPKETGLTFNGGLS